jgi:hypothetical protein
MAEQLAEKCLLEEVLYQGMSLLMPQTLCSQRRALAPAVSRARKITFSASCEALPFQNKFELTHCRIPGV